MFEFLSNFYFKHINEINSFSEDNLRNMKMYEISSETVEQKMKYIVNDYINLNSVLIVYHCNEDIKYFLSYFTKEYCCVNKLSEFNDVLLMNSLIFI